jgi:hypothetical protein
MIKIQGEGKSHDSLIGDAKSNQMIRIKDGTKSGFKDWILKLKKENPFASLGLTVPANRLC